MKTGLLKLLSCVLGLASVVIGSSFVWAGIIVGAGSVACALPVIEDESTKNGLAVAGVILGALGIVISVSAMMGNPIISIPISLNG